MRPKYFHKDVFFCTVQITAVGATPARDLSATTFIVQDSSKKPLPERLSLLFFNRSFIEEANGKITLHFNLQELNGGIGEVGQIIEQTVSDMDVYGKDALLYLAHPNTSKDVACIIISHQLSGYYPSDDYGIYYCALTPEWFAGDADGELPSNPNICLVGFPHGVHNILNLPLCRGFEMVGLGSAIERGDTPFLFNAPLLGGCGGGPIFVETNNGHGLEHRLIGVLSASSAITGDDEGVGTVVPITALKQLLNLAVERANDPKFTRKRLPYVGEPHLMLDYALAVF